MILNLKYLVKIFVIARSRDLRVFDTNTGKLILMEMQNMIADPSGHMMEPNLPFITIYRVPQTIIQ